jgi:septum formation protein
MRLILASASPRRMDLLREAGYDFDVEPADVDESALAGEAPRAYVVRVASLKARTVAAGHPDDIVLAADTTVVIGGELLAKPADDDDARRMLGRLAGRTHEVLTGVAVVAAGRERSTVVATKVRFRPMTAAEIDWYVASGEPRDKAGAYGVQGLASRFVESVDGSYSNVVGLPAGAVKALLEAAGLGGARPRPRGRRDRAGAV